MGPLADLTIVEFAGLGPGPFCGMMLADLGADVIRVERPDAGSAAVSDPLARNRKSLACNLKDPDAIEAVLRVIDTVDGLIEGFRPGVMERLGLGPDVCLERNPALAYGRMTGWGQNGPLAPSAGHDINYIALTGALHLIGEKGRKPVPPMNFVADFGGGGMLLAFGMLAAIINARATGKGQIVDAAMLDGVNAMMSVVHGLGRAGLQPDQTGAGLLNGAAHFYNTYETRDGRYVAIGSIEPQFYEILIEKAGLDRERFGPYAFNGTADKAVRQKWAELEAEMAEVFREKTLAEWCEIMECTDVCFAPVLTMAEAYEHPHNVARDAFVDVGGSQQAAPAPRFSRTPSSPPQPGVAPGSNSREVLSAAGLTAREIDALLNSGAVTQRECTVRDNC